MCGRGRRAALERVQALRRRHRRRRRGARHRRPRVHGPARPVRLRQVHAAADGRRAGGSDRRRHLHRRPAGQRRAAEAARRRDGLPELRALPAQDRAGEHRVPAQGRGASARRERSHAGAGGGAGARARASCSTASRASSAAASASVSRSPGRSCATRPCSAWTSRCPTSTPSCAARPAPSSSTCTGGSTATFLYVTHDQVEAMTMGTRVAVMSAGMLQQVGTPQEVYDKPASRLRRPVHRHAADERAARRAARAQRRARRRAARAPHARPARVRSPRRSGSSSRWATRR